MYLKSIEMQGFKSFPDRTKLIFDVGSKAGNGGQGENGVTVIVGPNGSGKSNIGDAMRWVLGEISSKSLRGTKMEDVIFGGAASRRPMGFAEVSVTFDNTSEFARLDCPYDEVTVTRRYFRAGESEYYINRKAVRLKDIYELFMNTGIGRDGYSIIGQGRIAEIISRKSDERRNVFEEASGIAKFRHRRTEAERKLQNVDANMDRVNDIFTEVQSQLAPLEREAARAEKAIALLDEKKRVDVQLWLYDTERLRGEVSGAEEAVRRSEFDLRNAEETLETLDTQSKKLYESAQSSRAEVARLAEQIRVCTEESFSLDGEYRVLENNIRHAGEMITAAQNALSNADGAAQAAQAEVEAQKNRIAGLEAAAVEQRKQYGALGTQIDEALAKDAQLQSEIGQALCDKEAAEREATDLRVRVSVLENAKNSDGSRTDGMLGDMTAYEEQIAELVGKQASRKRAADGYAAEIAKIDSGKEALQTALTGYNETYGRASEEANAARLRRDSLEQRIRTCRAMEENFEGYAQSVRYVMKQYAEGRVTDLHGAPCGKIYGPLSKVIRVEDRYVTAVETALGANLQHIVVQDEATAQGAMYCLKRANAGRATFFPLTSMRPQNVTEEMRQAAGFAGYIAVADTLVQCDARFSNVVSALLGRTVIFDTVENATAMAKSLRYRVRAVTLDGQQINVGGSFTGGSVNRNGSILGRAGEIRHLEEQAAEQRKALEEAEAQAGRLREQIRDMTDQIADLDDRRGLIAVLMNTENGQLEAVSATLDAKRGLLAKLKEDYEQIIGMFERYDSEIAGLREEEQALQEKIDAITAVRAQKSEACADLADRIRTLEEERTRVLITVNGTEKDIETAQTLCRTAMERVRTCGEEKESTVARIAQLEAKLADDRQKQTQNRTSYAEKEAELGRLRGERSQTQQDADAFEQKISNLNERIRQKMADKEVIFRACTVNQNKLDNLRATLDALSGKLYEEYNLTRNDALALGYPALQPEERDATEKIQTECRNKLRYLGHVDLDAANKYREIRERYEDMKTQIDDLETSRKELTGIINDLDTEMRTAFTESFFKINQHFKNTVAALFGGGEAELTLSDPENVLESGIEIKAAPPGKIIKSLLQLSGGEQAFVAVALFFAILQVNPTPFCILDEIEAALDEVNVERLAQYIRRYADGTQFILITHRRGTMAAATRLYGVTMPEHGISKVLSLDVRDISGKKEGDWDGIFG